MPISIACPQQTMAQPQGPVERPGLASCSPGFRSNFSQGREVGRSGSTRLTLEVAYQNTGAIPIRSLFSHIFSLAPGGTAGSEGFVVYPEGDGLVKKGWTLGSGSSTRIRSTRVSTWWSVPGSPTKAWRGCRTFLEHAIKRYLTSVSSLEERIHLGDLSAGWWPLTRRPLAVSGFSYAFYRSPPKGERVAVTELVLS